MRLKINSVYICVSVSRFFSAALQLTVTGLARPVREAQGSLGREQAIKRLGLFPSEPKAPAGPCGTERVASMWEPAALPAASAAGHRLSPVWASPQGQQHVGNTQGPRTAGLPTPGHWSGACQMARPGASSLSDRPPGACRAGVHAATRGETVRRRDLGSPGTRPLGPPPHRAGSCFWHMGRKALLAPARREGP